MRSVTEFVLLPLALLLGGAVSEFSESDSDLDSESVSKAESDSDSEFSESASKSEFESDFSEKGYLTKPLIALLKFFRLLLYFFVN